MAKKQFRPDEFLIAQGLAEQWRPIFRRVVDRDKWYRIDTGIWRPIEGDIGMLTWRAMTDAGANVLLTDMRAAIKMLGAHPAFAVTSRDAIVKLDGAVLKVTDAPLARTSQTGRQYVVAHADDVHGPLTILAFADDARAALKSAAPGDVLAIDGTAKISFYDGCPTIEAATIYQTDVKDEPQTVRQIFEPHPACLTLH